MKQWKPVPRKLKAASRNLRKNSTPAEKILWEALRDHQLDRKIRRQHVVGEHFIADLYHHHNRLIIELDGSIHDEPDQHEYDVFRQETLERLGYQIVRIRNEQIENDLEATLDLIKESLNRPKPKPRKK
jgi:very-short-patch-repair endonuclease